MTNSQFTNLVNLLHEEQVPFELVDEREPNPGRHLLHPSERDWKLDAWDGGGWLYVLDRYNADTVMIMDYAEVYEYILDLED